MSIEVGHISDLYNNFVESYAKKVGNRMKVPRLQAVYLNVGCGKFHKDSARLAYIEEELDRIAGQKSVRTKIKKSISNFSIREGMTVGIRVTLRKNNMMDFLTRLIMIAIPRMQDFNGINHKSFDHDNNLNFGIDRQDIFPESDGHHLFGMNICIKIRAASKADAIELLKGISLPVIGGVNAAE